MRKVVFSIVIIIATFVLSACRTQMAYPLLCNEDEIQDIAVVSAWYDGEFHEKVIGFTDITDTLTGFRKVQSYLYYGEPLAPVYENEETLLRITYTNGSKEWINWKGQAHYTLDRGFRFYAGYYVFDEQSFSTLIKSLTAVVETTAEG